MRIALAANDSLGSRYLIERLHKGLPPEHSLTLIVHETGGYPWRRHFHRFLKRASPNFVRGLFSNPYWRIGAVERRALASEREILFGSKPPQLPKAIPVLTCQRVGGEEVIERIAALGIDLIVIFGVLPVSREALARMPRVIGLNLGDLPIYRGLHGLVWAAYERDREHFRVTLHEVIPEIGVGTVLARGRIDRNPVLGYTTMRALGTVRLAEMLLEEIGRLPDFDPSAGEGVAGDIPPLRCPAPLWARWKAARQIAKWCKK